MSDNGEAWARLDQRDQDRLTRAIKLLSEAHSKRLSPAGILTWCRALAPFAKQASLWRALEASCEEARFPSIAQVKSLMRGRPETESFKPIPPLTPEQKRRADHAAVLSMLWLHYTQGWRLTDFHGTVLAKAFGKDPHEALAAAVAVYDEATVRRWMSDQQRAGN